MFMKLFQIIIKIFENNFKSINIKFNILNV